MSSKHVYDEVETYLRANWLTTPILAEENVFERPPTTREEWVGFGFAPATEDFISLGAGNRCTRESGALLLVVFTPSGAGTDLAREYADQLRAMFRSLWLNGIRFKEASPPDTYLPNRENASLGNWHGLQTLVNYEYDYTTIAT